MRQPPVVTETVHERPYSTRNLIVNGGFVREPPDPRAGWDFPAGEGSSATWWRIPVRGVGRTGVPRAGHAVVLDSGGSPSGVRVSQEIPLRDVPTRRFAVGLAALGARPGSGMRLVVSIGGAAAAGREVIWRHPVRLSTGWERYRAELEVPDGASRLVLEIEMAGPGRTVTLTDVRLVGLLRPVDRIAVRFDTAGDMARASSRLRAFMLEDYLHLLGCRTAVNGGTGFDIHVFQKVEPWLGLARARLGRKTVVFDVDDNEMLYSRWRALKVRGFARMADAVSVGSAFLRDTMMESNPCTFVLENPVDVLDDEVVRDDRPWKDRLVWFGMPENRWMLERLALERPVTTITRGGSVEYDLGSIDHHLVASDLALLPVVSNDDTRAKNANRLLKCVGLGLPFLAGDTAEHRRVLQALQLPEDLLVATDREWAGRIDGIAADYTRYRGVVADARPRAFARYGVERIAADWMAALHRIPSGEPAGEEPG